MAAPITVGPGPWPSTSTRLPGTTPHHADSVPATVPVRAFTMIAHGAAPRGRLRLVGELDLVTAPALQQMLDHLRGRGRRYLGLDLSELTFLAAAGLHVFEQADRQFRDAGGWLVLTHPTDRTRRLLDITELHSVLTVHPHRGAPPAAPRAGGFTAVIAF